MAEYIRYVKLDITIAFLNSAPVPEFKGSTFRGGLGDVLLQEHCIGDLDCRKCDFAETCVVPNIYYHPLKIVPSSVKDGGSLGYTFECPDRRTSVHKGDEMLFSLLLYGDVIVCFSTILDGLYRLGLTGIGQKKQAKFQIVRILDQDGNAVFDHGSVDPRRIRVRNLMEDSREKAAALSRNCDGTSPFDCMISFESLWTQKWHGEFLKDFNLPAFAESVYRRIYLLHCLEGIPFPEKREFDLAGTASASIRKKNGAETRYSNTHNASIRLAGIEGAFLLRNLPADFIPFLYAAETVHIGKNTSIGFGKFSVRPLDT